MGDRLPGAHVRGWAMWEDGSSAVSVTPLTNFHAHGFQFGEHYEEMCPTYEEFAALLGNDSLRAPVAAPTRAGLFRSFMRMLGLSMEEAKELVVDDQANLAGLIDQYLDPLDFKGLEF
ncbi:hypothetical protein JCGZ_23715 [Jatropha curcas]|uniref:Uncharacterized protein n=1 Tax=Jatropha curcas TaxID=180498 RepID=A0A067K0J6_JATCU|nr:hypothetical protein JCGZ_23715 [Jatropha curcas]